MSSSNNFLPKSTIDNGTFVCIIMDDSGSMGEPAATSVEALGYTRNDFSLQGAKLCVNGAPDNLHMGVIKFNSTASVVHSPVKLTSTNRLSLLDSISRIRPTGGTRIFTAIQQAKKMFDQVQEIYGITKFHIILFTDGEDETLTESNVQSHLLTLAVGGEFPFTMDTVGFGPNANTQLLVRMASLCGGTYALCYDASMVGTIFGRAIARTYLGHEAYGIHESDSPKSAEYYQIAEEYHKFRTELSELLLANYRMLPDRVQAVDAFNAKLEQWIGTTSFADQADPNWSSLICGLHANVNDQIRLAVSDPNYWTLWGKAYWQMMGIALDKQYAPNFKDACLQIFGSQRAKTEYARISDIYNEMPMPPPSDTYRAATRTAPPPTTSAAFNNQNAGCFHPYSRVLLESDVWTSFVEVEQMIKSGQQVRLQSTNIANDKIVVLEALIKSDRRSGPTQFCQVGTVVLTPTHPLANPEDGQWIHPKTLSPIYEEQVNCVYNVVLAPSTVTGKRAQSILVDAQECVGLAHGIEECVSKVAYDTFWGSEDIVNVLKRLYPLEYPTGVVNFNAKLKRSELTGWVESVVSESI
jgi:hypothetical protein